MDNSIAILIPCYNDAKFLPELFQCINEQTVPFDEVLCYDDCSNDNTIQVAEEFGARVIKGKENKGAGHGRNILVSHCTSNWIHFHDADDLIAPSFVEVFKKNLLSEETQVVCNMSVYDRELRAQKLGEVNYEKLNTCKDQIEYFLDNVGYAIIGVYSKRAILDIGGFKVGIRGNEDPDLHIRLVNAGYKVKSIPYYLVTNLVHAKSFSQKNWMLCIEDKLICYESYLSILGEKYFGTIGKHLAICGAFFYAHNNIEAGDKVLELLKKAGVKTIRTSKFSHIFTYIFGIRTYYKLLQFKANFKFINV